MLQTESLRKQPLAFFAPRMWEIRRKLQSRRSSLRGLPLVLGSNVDRCVLESACDGLASPRRLQQTSEISGPGGLVCIPLRGEDSWVFSVPMGSRCEACCANLSAICSVCFASGKMNHTIPIILLRAMLHLFFSSGMIIYIHKPHSPRIFKNSANGSHLFSSFLDTHIATLYRGPVPSHNGPSLYGRCNSLLMIDDDDTQFRSPNWLLTSPSTWTTAL
ncbi:hypothetical protein J3E69DRAFT_341072 [Trichoderma sp. SZMC 28015]